ncbi:MAG: hypothetical protein K2Q18_17965 [Bdellovibrionales bacterium]|nr:hypothetical protein [Bdellovibrionales bacterium]
MKIILRFFIIFLLPSICYADGVSSQTWTLASSHFAFLVKVMAIDSVRFKAKVKLLKKFSPLNNSKDKTPNIFSLNFFDQNNNKIEKPINWNELVPDSEYTITLKRPVESEPDSWVLDDTYWDETKNPDIGLNAYIISNNTASYTWVKETSFNKIKFDYFYNQNQDEKDKYIKPLPDLALLTWLKDEDLKKAALLELESRNAIGPKLFLDPELENKFIWILRDYLEGQDSIKKKKILNSFYDFMIKEKVSDDSIAAFLKLLNYLPPELLSFDQELELGILLNYQGTKDFSSYNPVNEAIRSIHHKVKVKHINGYLLKILDQALDAFIYESNPTLSLDDIYNYATESERTSFLRKQVERLKEIGFSKNYSGYFSAAIFKLQTAPDLIASESLISIDLSSAPTNIKVAALEAVFEGMTKFGDMSDAKKRKDLINFIEKYIDPRIPNYLNESTMKRFSELKKQI